MATVNKRTKIVQAAVINGVDAGGLMSARIGCGYDQVLRSGPDGLQGPPLQDRFLQFCRGEIVSQDYTEMIALLTGTVGTYVCYERKSGVAEASGYIKHTVNNPVVHNARLSISKDGYATCGVSFECRAADETKGFADMWQQLDTQSKPAYVSAARGGWRVKSCAFDPDGAAPSISIYHVTAFEFAVALMMQMDSNDADVGYTCVDVEPEGSFGGSLAFQDSTIATNLLCQRLLAAARGVLTITLASGAGGADKVITINGVEFERVDRSMGSGFAGHTINYSISNNATTPLSLTGANKIITIA